MHVISTSKLSQVTYQREDFQQRHISCDHAEVEIGKTQIKRISVKQYVIS